MTGQDLPDDEMRRGRFATVRRQGDTVERRGGTTNTRALLRHFARKGFDLAPRLLGTTPDGYSETLSYIPGSTGYPPLRPQLRSEEALINVAGAVRRMHDATDGFIAPEPQGWHAHEVAMPVRVDCVGHRDLAPWNIVFDGSRVNGIIDWDFAGPSNRVWDLSYAAHQFVPLHQESHLGPFGWSPCPDRARRLRMFAAAYGDVDPAELLDLAAVRMAAIAAHVEGEVRRGNPDYAVHRDEDHATAYRGAAMFIMANRAALLAG